MPRHEAHIFLVLNRRKPFSKREESRMYRILEKTLSKEFKAQVLKLEVVIP